MSEANSAADCLARFREAVRDGRRGDYARAHVIVRSVRTKHGSDAAERAHKELKAYIDSEKPL